MRVRTTACWRTHPIFGSDAAADQPGTTYIQSDTRCFPEFSRIVRAFLAMYELHSSDRTPVLFPRTGNGGRVRSMTVRLLHRESNHLEPRWGDDSSQFYSGQHSFVKLCAVSGAFRDDAIRRPGTVTNHSISRFISERIWMISQFPSFGVQAVKLSVGRTMSICLLSASLVIEWQNESERIVPGSLCLVLKSSSPCPACDSQESLFLR